MQYLPPGKAVEPSVPREAVNKVASTCRGIVYLPNPDVTADGKKLLMMAEKKRDSQCLDSDTAADSEGSTPAHSPSHSPNRMVTPTKRSSSVTKLPAIFEEAADEATQQRVIRKKEDSRYDGQWRKIIVDAMRAEGPQPFQCWQAALRFIMLTRLLLQDIADKLPEGHPEARLSEEDTKVIAELGSLGVSVGASNRSIISPNGAGDEDPDDELRRTGIRTKEEPNEDEVVSISDRNQANRPRARERGHTSLPQGGALQDRYESERPPDPFVMPAPEINNQETSSSIQDASSSSRHLPRQPKRAGSMSFAQEPKVSKTLRFGFDDDIWRRILADASSADDVLSPTQQKACMQYGQDWRSLVRESEIVGKPVQQQIWRILETVGCLNYEGSA